MKKVRSLNVIVCTGKPNSGKTTFATALNLLSASHKDNRSRPDEVTASTAYRTDKAYMDFLRAEGLVPEGRVVNIAGHFPKLAPEHQHKFGDFLLAELDAFAATTLHTLIVEGWQAEHYLERIRERFGRERFVLVPFQGHGFEVEGRRFEIPRLPLLPYETNFSFHQTKRALAANVQVASELFCFLRERAIVQLTQETRYQCFDDLGMQVRSSDSPRKFAALQLQTVLPEKPGAPKRVLDVGCQNGYVCFRIARLSPRYRVHGIDTNRKAVLQAARYNAQVYELPNVEFKHGNIFECRQRNVDLIVAASVFHYFRERQEEFFEMVHGMLRRGGILVLECGVSTQQPDVPFVERRSRKVDGDNPCFFPNRARLAEMTRRFVRTYEGPSVLQKGDPLPRSVFHFQKVSD